MPDTELIRTCDGTGKAHGYEVVEAPDPDILTLEQSDSEVHTYHREVDIRVYFRRMQ